ncbi:MAG: penicillin-binding protein 2 [Thermoleophilia bacterium]|nr:penicillin-binding protein 2 [Thermoleophilia bacterium]
MPRDRRRAPADDARPRGRRGDPDRAASRRIRLIALATVGVLGVMALRAGWIATVEAGELSQKAQDQHESTIKLPAPRGAILSADGRELAVDKHAVAVTATPYLITDKRGTAEKIATAVGLPVAEVEKRISGRGGYAMLNTGVDQQRERYLRKLDLPGITLQDTQKRLYPLGSVAAQLVGMTDDWGAGLTGLEKTMESHLKGTEGLREEARDPDGRALQIIRDKAPTPGTPITLTLNSAIQQKTEAVLADVVERNSAKAASAIVMRPDTGEVLAMATVPGFNPNDRDTFVPETERMRSITDAYEPGSTFKLVAVAGAIEEGVVTRDTVFNLPETLTMYDRTLKEAHYRPAVSWRVEEILQNSSNVGTVLISQKLGQQKTYDWIQRFGFGQKTGFDYPGEVTGSLPKFEDWSGVSILNIPIGQGISVTMAQIAEAYGAIANKGRMVPPHIIQKIGNKVLPHPRGQQIIKPRTAQQLNIMLQKVVSDDGTGKEASIAGYTVGGKTGTANKIDPNTGAYTETYIASFVGYAPATHPGVVTAVMVDEPSAGSFYGGDVAAPAFEQITAFALRQLRIAP